MVAETSDVHVLCAHTRPVDPANTQLGVAKRVAGDIGYCLGLGPKSATREVAGSAFCPSRVSRRLLSFAGSTGPACARGRARTARRRPSSPDSSETRH